MNQQQIDVMTKMHADMAALQATVQQQQQQLLQQQQQMLQQAQSGASAAAVASASPARTFRPKIASERMFAGTASLLDGWLLEMKQQFTYYQLAAASEQVGMAAAHLKGVALDWWALQLSPSDQSHLFTSFAEFEKALRGRFQPINSAQTARLALDSFRQGAKQSVADYISAFRRLLVAVPDMGESDRVHQFVRGLRQPAQSQLLIHGVATLDKAIEMASRVGSLALYAASSATAAGMSNAHGAGHRDAMDLSGIEGLEQSTDGDDADDAAAPITRGELRKMLNAMQQQRSGGASNRGGKRAPFGRGGRSGGPPRISGLTEAQVKERLEGGLCFLCGEAGHRKFDCPKNKQSTN